MQQAFLVHQTIRYLDERGDVKRYLQPDLFRTRRNAGGQNEKIDLGNWVEWERAEFVEQIGTKAMLRTVLTTDAGVGKSINVEQLQAQISRRFPRQVVVRVKLGDMETRISKELKPEKVIDEYLVEHFRRNSATFESRVPPDKVARWLKRAVATGSLILLFDELDQIAAKGSASLTLVDCVQSEYWSKCAILVAGRPYAIQDHWGDIFSRPDWRFFQLVGFTETQQRTFLRDAEGNDRYGELLEEVRGELKDILAVPRVLSYLRELNRAEFTAIRTASDVYLSAVFHLVRRGLAGNAKAAEFGLPSGKKPERVGELFDVDQERVAQAVDVLAAMAWEMLWLGQTSSGVSTTPPIGSIDNPNFNQVSGVEAIRTLTNRTFERLKELNYYSDFVVLRNDLGCLKSMNEALERGVVEASLSEQLLWRNRSLQEFLAAYSLCRMAPTDVDLERLWRWVYLPNQPAVPAAPSTESFYWIWRFAAEMDLNNRVDVVRPEAWCQSMSPLFRPGTGNAIDTKRSTEMIFRTWDRMERWGSKFLRPFLSEFQSILDGQQIGGVDGERAQRAHEFKSLFIVVPESRPFRMGTPPEKQGMPPEDRLELEEKLADGKRNPDAFLAERARDDEAWIRNHPEKQRIQLSQERRELWIAILEKGVEHYEQIFYKANETPEISWQAVNMPQFQLNAFPTLRGWYALFDPGHGRRHEAFATELSRIASSAEHSALFVTWYDAWVFCQFAHWNGQSCRLPHEDEWEKGAKAQRTWDEWEWRYWWGDTDSEAHRTCNQDRESGESTSPCGHLSNRLGEGHKNWLGFVDILGNQWEWTADEYRKQYSRAADALPDNTSRVCRGGAWSGRPAFVRSSVRGSFPPTYLSGSIGFRVARALEIT